MKNRWEIKSYKVFQCFLLYPLLLEDSQYPDWCHLAIYRLRLSLITSNDAINQSSSRLSLRYTLLPFRNILIFIFCRILHNHFFDFCLCYDHWEPLLYTIPSFFNSTLFSGLGFYPWKLVPKLNPSTLITSTGHPLPPSKFLHSYGKIYPVPAHFGIIWHRGKVSF